MLAEIRAGEKLRNDRMGRHKARVESYGGPGFWSRMTSGNPDNHDFEWVALVSPQIVFQNPRFLTRTEKPEHRLWSIAARHYMNRHVHETNCKKEWERLALDFGFLWGVSHVTPAPLPGAQFDEVKRRPQLRRIPQDRFSADAAAQDWEQSRFFAVRVVMDKDAALARAKKEKGWNLKALEALSSGKIEKITRPTNDYPHRDEISWWEVWIPELDSGDDKHHHGSIVCYADVGIPRDMDGHKPLREAVSFFGPPSGPFTQYGAYYVPGELYSLSPLSATHEQVVDLNLHAKALSRGGAQRKKILLIDSMDGPNFGDRVLACPDGGAIPVDGFDKQHVADIELGGVTEQGLAYYQLARERLDRVSGIHEVARGNVASGDTATAVAVAARAQADRLGFLAEKFYESATKDSEKMLWYALLDERVVETLPEDFLDELREMGVDIPPGATAKFEGGDFDGDPADLEIRIEPMSMRRTDEGIQQGRAMQVFETMMAIAPSLPQISLYMDVEGILSDFGDAMNMPHLAERVDTTKARMIGAAMLGAQLNPQETPAGNAKSPPRFSSDVGVRPASSGGSKPKPVNGKTAQRSLPGYSAGNAAATSTRKAGAA